MPKSQRVLSGSKTKGTTATLTGSVQFFYQGINVRTFPSYVGSLLPRVGSGDRLEIYKDGSKLSEKTFDDSITINNTLVDIGSESGPKRIEERVGFGFEKRNFGQAPATLLGEPFADVIEFDPVSYIKDQNEVMWPVNMWNAGSLNNHEYDGVIEPLDIRREIFGDIDTRYDGYAVRGSLVGAASEQPWGSIEITDSWFHYNVTPSPFFDAPDSFVGPYDKPGQEYTLLTGSTSFGEWKSVGVGKSFTYSPVATNGTLYGALFNQPAVRLSGPNWRFTSDNLNKAKYTITLNLAIDDRTNPFEDNDTVFVEQSEDGGTSFDVIAIYQLNKESPKIAELFSAAGQSLAKKVLDVDLKGKNNIIRVSRGSGAANEFVYLWGLEVSPVSTPLTNVALPSYQNIQPEPTRPYVESTNYHDRVYFALNAHNNSDMRQAMRLLNSSSCRNLTDPLEKRAARGFYFHDSAGSITFRDTYIAGETE